MRVHRLYLALLCVFTSATFAAHAQFINTTPVFDTPTFLLDVGEPIIDVAYRADGLVLAVASTQQVTFWDTNTGDLIRAFQRPEPVTRIAFAPNDQLLILEGTDFVRWDVPLEGSGGSAYGFTLPLPARDFAIAPDGETLALIMEGGASGIVSVMAINGGGEARDLSLDVEIIGD